MLYVNQLGELIGLPGPVGPLRGPINVYQIGKIKEASASVHRVQGDGHAGRRRPHTGNRRAARAALLPIVYGKSEIFLVLESIKLAIFLTLLEVTGCLAAALRPRSDITDLESIKSASYFHKHGS